MSGRVTEQGETYQPEVLLWMSSEGMIVGVNAGPPGTLLAVAGDDLARTIAAPASGRPERPTHVRVASPALADALRVAHPNLRVSCAPTPEIDDALAGLDQHVAAARRSMSLVAAGLERAAIASFFRAAAALHEVAPWLVVPDDRHLVGVSAPALGLGDGVVSVIGHLGRSHGFLLFRTPDDFEAFLDMAALAEDGGEPPIPPHVSLVFEPLAELDELCHEDIAAHGWPLASPDAYPVVDVVEPGGIARAPTTTELALLEAVAGGLTTPSDGRPPDHPGQPNPPSHVLVHPFSVQLPPSMPQSFVVAHSAGVSEHSYVVVGPKQPWCWTLRHAAPALQSASVLHVVGTHEPRPSPHAQISSAAHCESSVHPS